ncbi:MAG TPA: HAMP domain-containing sensor histidine kinase [Chthoniobacterales bacterium]|jgi:signal transduction histidine kinase
MSAAIPAASRERAARFRTKLAAAMMLTVAILTGLGLYLAQRRVTADAEQNLQQNFQAELVTLQKLEDLRHAALAERCLALAAKPRIHAALEDNALDLLYPSAKDELRDLMDARAPAPLQAARSLHAKFYRFLDRSGAVLPPPNPDDVGKLAAEAEAQLSLKQLPTMQQIGYIWENDGGIVDEVIAAPIFSTDTGEVIGALVIGFTPPELEAGRATAEMQSGIWVKRRLHMPTVRPNAQAELGEQIARALAAGDGAQNNFRVTVEGAPQLLFYKRLNPDSLFPPAYEIRVYSLAPALNQLHRLRWEIGGAGMVLLLVGFVASHFVAVRLSRPVEQLAVASEQDRAQRERVEAELAETSEELERSSRYSADASHQLKSPVTVLRAGLESLLTREDFKPEIYEELSDLLHQTHRLTGVIDDLLLLSRMDAGHLRIASEPVNLSELIDEWLDDLAALPDGPEVKIEKQFPPQLHVAGEKRYTSLIVQNLLENARKYNRPGGRMFVGAQRRANDVVLTVGNTGHTIPPEVQPHIFKRFQRGATHSPVGGHGLGLNVACELARLHGGELRLVRSENDWTEFEIRFRAVAQKPEQAAQAAA